MRRATSVVKLLRPQVPPLPHCIGMLPHCCSGKLPHCIGLIPQCSGMLPHCSGKLPHCSGLLPHCSYRTVVAIYRTVAFYHTVVACYRTVVVWLSLYNEGAEALPWFCCIRSSWQFTMPHRVAPVALIRCMESRPGSFRKITCDVSIYYSSHSLSVIQTLTPRASRDYSLTTHCDTPSE